MSITLSIYDVFANLLPGLLYLFAINEFFKSIGLNHIDQADLTAMPQTLGALTLGYILGHLFNTFTYTGWYKLIYRNGSDQDRNNQKGDNGKALDSLRKQYPDLNFKSFFPRDADLLFSAIQIKNKELADRIETTRVTAIMMRNISFGLSLLGVVELINFVNSQFPLYHLGLGLVCLVGSMAALMQTSKYYQWFYKDVFRIAALYGDSLHSVVNLFRKDSKTKSK
jgi:hypothetical protein